MEATDLMIGDCVNIYTFPNDNPLEKDLFPAKVVSILDGLPTEQLHTIECIFPNKDGGYGIASRPVETCLPIPLTPKILEKNGFEYFHKNYASISREHPFMLRMDKWPDENGLGGVWTICDIIKICYVHELQHALKLCEIKKEIVL